ncbi:MAG TPA: 6-phosphogluconolactonase, partial [Woeseiaceae bacterium]|nr:6-phosphogluconolactonase [Woeseiaceae bacterium]
QASTMAASHLADALKSALRAGGNATLVAGGGMTPLDTYRRLARTALDWHAVHVTLSDERWVAPSDASSNERMLRNTLLTGTAAAATFHPLYRPGTSAEAACAALEADFDSLPQPLAGALLGMGEDGHFASLFAGAGNLRDALDVDGTRLCMAVHPPASPGVRMSLTLAALLRSSEINLLLFGDAKRAVYEQARATGSSLPVAALLAQTRVPVRVIWAP